MIDLKTLKSEINKLERETPGTSSALLQQLSTYFIQTAQSNLNGNIIKETEYHLNKLYIRCLDEKWADNIELQINKTLSLAVKMSSVVKKKLPFLRKEYANEFPENAKELGKSLRNLSYLIEHLSD